MNQLINLTSPQNTQEGIFDSRFLVVLGGVIFLILATGYFFYGLQPTLVSESEVNIEIDRGESFRTIGAKLSQESLIRSIFVFKAYSLFTGKASNFKPGSYNFNADMSVPEITNKLVEGGETEVSVTIPEGLTLKDADYLLSQAEIIEPGAIEEFRISSDLEEDFVFLGEVNSLEGFLFPDTYRFNKGSEVEEVVKTFLNNFEKKAWPLIKNKNNWYDSLILASFLEREVKTLEDKKIVSGILLKRLDAGMKLQVDATISYAKCDKSFLRCENVGIARSDIDLSSPYNTYERFGWTPTPISNPGLSSLEATLDPAENPYWYYLSASETGETIFSRSLEEHNENRVKYL